MDVQEASTGYALSDWHAYCLVQSDGPAARRQRLWPVAGGLARARGPIRLAWVTIAMAHLAPYSVPVGYCLSRRHFLGLLGALATGAAAGGCSWFRPPRPTFPPVEGTTSAERAISAARRFAGATLRVAWESGLQAQDPLRYSGPLWEQQTGIRVDVLEIGTPSEQFRRILAEHYANTGAFDCAGIAPAWLPDLVAEGALEPLDDFINHYLVPSDLDDYLPLYQHLGRLNGYHYGLFDDGDVLLVYYRRDLFADPANQREFADQYGRPLGDPSTYDWQQFRDAAEFFTVKYAPRLYGLAPFSRDLRWGWFETLLRTKGGQFFDATTMKPGINSAVAIEAMAALAELTRFQPPTPGDVDAPTIISTFLSGGAAMASFWPPLGRWSESYAGGPPLPVVPRSQVAGRVGYALLPGGYTTMRVGFALSLLSQSRQKEAAYLFIQWLTSPEISLQRVMLPYALRDPYRWSHINSPTYRALWPAAPAYLDTLRLAATDRGLIDLIMPGADDYVEAFHAAATDVRLGTAVPEALDRLAARWETITEQHGRSRQRAAYRSYLERKGATVG